MYVITDHNTQNFVILGPIEWKPRYISDILSDELDQDIVITKDDESRVPFDVAPGVTIRDTSNCYLGAERQRYYNGQSRLKKSSCFNEMG